MAGEGFISGIAGEEISLLFEGVKIAAIQNVDYKESQSKSPILGAGFKKAHGMGRGLKVYELNFEVKELNSAILEEPANAEMASETVLETFTVDGVSYTSLLDLRNCTVLVMYPVKNNIRKIGRFTGFEFTDVEGGYSLDDEAVTKKCSGIALDAKGII